MIIIAKKNLKKVSAAGGSLDFGVPKNANHNLTVGGNASYSFGHNDNTTIGIGGTYSNNGYSTVNSNLTYSPHNDWNVSAGISADNQGNISGKITTEIKF